MVDLRYAADVPSPKSAKGADSRESTPLRCITQELASYLRRDARTIACHGHHLLYPNRYGVILADTCPARGYSISDPAAVSTRRARYPIRKPGHSSVST